MYLIVKQFIYLFFGFRTSFRPTNDGQLIQLMHRGMRTGQALFLLGIEPGIPRIRPWKELLATGAQATWLNSLYIYLLCFLINQTTVN